MPAVSKPSLSFLGAARTVTGSRYLLEASGRRVLIDCGLFQGVKKLRLRNWESASRIDAKRLDAVVLTHAHIDHSGFLPRLRKLGFDGPIWCTTGTRDLLEVLLPDSGYLQEEQARHANRYGYSKHTPALPLYTRADAEACLAQLRPVAYAEKFAPCPEVVATTSRAGHILGSACVRIATGGTSITFSGDVGRPIDPIMAPPERLASTDHLVIESTYGDRRHSEEPIADQLAAVVRETIERRGTVVVPAFAVGRAQHLLHLLADLTASGAIPRVPVFLDSPMAINASQIFCRHPEDHGLAEGACHAMCQLAKYVRTADESRALDRREDPMIVVAASGMLTGGRVLHHLRRFLPDRRNTLLLVGYQPKGTRGRALLDGKDEIKVLGKFVRVRAHIKMLPGLSAHADSGELADWLAASEIAPRRVFVTHGEPSASNALQKLLKERFGWNVSVPEDGATVELR